MSLDEQQYTSLLINISDKKSTIDELATFIIYAKKDKLKAFSIWNEQYYLASSDQKIALLFLANEVIMRTVHATLDYLKGLGALLHNTFDALIEATSDIQILEKMFRLIENWAMFGIFSTNFLQKLKNKLKPKYDLVREEIQRQSVQMQEGKQAEMRNLKIVKEYDETFALLELDIIEQELRQKQKLVEHDKAEFDLLMKNKAYKDLSSDELKIVEHFEGMTKNFQNTIANVNKKRTEVIYLLSQKAHSLYSQYVTDNSNELILKTIEIKYNKAKP